MDTRDILTVKLRRKSEGENVNFIVNHHPSKFGGSKASEGRRTAVMKSLSELCDSLLKLPENAEIVAMGDLFIEWDREANRVYMTGPAEVSFEGEIQL